MKNKNIKIFSERFNLKNLDQGLLRQAFTHSSVGKKNNERLEFFGDAILGCVIAEELFMKLPHAKENYLTRLRSHLVNKNTLASLAQELNFSDMVLLGEGERRTGGRQRDSVLADAFEAVIGAIFVSTNYIETQQYILTVYSKLLAELPKESDLKDPKTRLQEYLQQRSLPIPQYEIIEEVGKPHAKTFTVEVRVYMDKKLTPASIKSIKANGPSRRAAEQQAAQDLLLLILEIKDK